MGFRQRHSPSARHGQYVALRISGESSTAEVLVHPNGNFVYGSNRGHDSIAVFAFDSASGKLTLVQHCSTGGKTPRNFRIDPSGQFLLAENQDSDSIVVLKMDQASGRLTAVGPPLRVGSPCCIKFMHPNTKRTQTN